MKKVLFVGEINVDVMMGGMPTPPIVDREVPATSWDVVMGGSTMLSACAYASLGGDVTFAGLAGKDDYGDFMLRGMSEYGLKTDLVRRSTEVRTGVTVNMISGNTRTQATYPGTIEEYDGADLDEHSLAGFDHVHFAGLYLETKLRPHMTRILRTAQRLGVTTSIDPQWDSSEKWEYMDEWLPLLTYLFVNEDEAVSITKAQNPEKALVALAARTKLPLVKLGKEGALVLVEGKITHVKGKVVKPVDTTGAGDSFDAGFLYATIEKGMPLLEAVRFANATAARSCLFTGGVAARSSYDDVVAFMKG
ncbi:MAG: carbohydrate kinase family protein [Acidobacteriota bacterium]